MQSVVKYNFLKAFRNIAERGAGVKINGNSKKIQNIWEQSINNDSIFKWDFKSCDTKLHLILTKICESNYSFY